MFYIFLGPLPPSTHPPSLGGGGVNTSSTSTDTVQHLARQRRHIADTRTPLLLISVNTYSYHPPC